MASGDASRQRLLRAAIELFTTRGYHLTTTPQIARKARLAEGTIYRHFPGKQELLNELYRGAVRWATGQAEVAQGDTLPPGSSSPVSPAPSWSAPPAIPR